MPALDGGPAEPLHVGVDLGTAYLVLAVLDRDMQPLAGEYQFAEVVRDGLVVDYLGAIDLLKEMKARVEKRLGVQLTHAASGFPPGVHQVEVRAMANVVDAVGLRCDTMVDEPTGGTHFSLVIAGAQDISFEAAEAMKVDPAEQARLFTAVRPVMEKVANIVAGHVAESQVKVEQLTLVGGTSAFPGMAAVVEEYTGIPTYIPERPVFVTPVGIAMNDMPSEEGY